MGNTRKPTRHNQEKILFVLMGLIVVGLIVSGYFLFVRKILPEIAAQTNQQLALASQAQQIESGTNAPAAEEFIPQEEAHSLKIYFGQRGKDLLTYELRRVRKRTMLIAQARQIVETLLEGPMSSSLYQPIPKGTTLRGIFFNSGTFIVDLSKEFANIANMGAAEQVLGVYSLVNSLTELDPRAKVRFLINGSEPVGNNGHVDISQALTRFENLADPKS
ncbi:MAG: GerMN domain-containing protein [Candidatus Riflebacteria bacterium]|nr:GerMN domain-containing protein [Candidatus Riflebacteria bacterium]